VELTDGDKELLRKSAELIWKRGVHNPDDAAVAFNFTEFVKRALTPTNNKSEDGK
jgi:hypothetical protein